MMKYSGFIRLLNNNRILVCEGDATASISAISMVDSTVSVVRNTSFNYLDGFAKDKEGNYYVSAWGENAVYKFNAQFDGQPELIVGSFQADQTGSGGPADIYINEWNDTLAIPLMNVDKVQFIKLANTTSVEEKLRQAPGIICSPNPASATLSISYDLESTDPMSIELVDMFGKTVYSLNRNTMNATIVIDVKDLPRGVYFINLKHDDKRYVSKIVLGY